MKVLISGKDSYIGDHIAEWLLASKETSFDVDFLDVRQSDWNKKVFEGYDAVVHVAGIVHRKDIIDPKIYDKVNTQLPYDVASKAKEAGVKQFVFLSTMAVYGVSKKLKENYVDLSTPIKPTSQYGLSKYNAELKLKQLENENFIISIVRPPNVYGKGCKGGYITGYASIVKKLPIIPDAYNNIKQSILYIDNLCEFIRLILVNKNRGIFLPQDDKAVSAVELMDAISSTIGLKKKKSPIFGLFPRLLSFVPLTVKGYGGIAYPKSASTYDGLDYIVVPFQEAIRKSL